MENQDQIVQKVLPGAAYVGKLATGVSLYNYKKEKVLVADDYDDLDFFIQQRLRSYFDDEPQQALYWFEKAGREDWPDFIQKKKLSQWLIDNFDSFTKGRFKHSKYRDLSIEDFKANPVECIIVYCGGDLAKISTVLQPFLNSEFYQEMTEVLNSQIFEQQGLYFALLVDLPRN